MQLIKDRQIIEDQQSFIADDQPLPASGNITVSFARWQQEKAQVTAFNGKIGVRLSPTDAAQDLAEDLDKLSLIEVDFPLYTDGRAFSHAKLLRTRLKYQGEIRAVGQFMADQVFYLSKVGVNAFQLAQTEHLPVALASLNDFSKSYQ